MLVLGTFTSFAQPAFPGALGFGANATGGRAGSVYHVTTLADSGAGSFRTAVSSPNRIVVFDVGGYINLSSAISVKDNITIAGQTAPGGGIGIMGREVSFNNAENVIVRHFRFRQGSLDPDSGKSGINLLTATNVILDHISIEFAQYDSIDAVTSDQITVQNSIIADPISQRFGAHTENIGASFSWFYNIWANEHGRQPLAKINTIFINNVVYDYQAGYDCGDTSGHFFHDVINNYFITGPATTSAGNNWYQMNGNQTFYAVGNLRDSNDDGVLNGSGTSPGGVIIASSPWSSFTANIPTFSTVAGYRYDLSAAGALPRDQVDQQVASNVKSLGTVGQLWNSQTATGLGNSGYGVINGGVAPIDTDGDGIPDYWEKAVAGLNFNSNDAMTIGADGYANIERYLNWLADPHALTVINTAVDVDLWQYTSGFTNASPAYSVTVTSNGVVTLNSGHLVHFTPPANFSGLGGFQFAVVANDGTAYTNTVTVVMSPIVPPSNLIWQGDGSANLWGNGTGTNWLNGANLVAFNSGDSVTFDDTGSNTPAIALSGSLPAGTVYVLAQQDYTFSGSGFLSGSTALFKTGSGQLNLFTANTATGGATINEGIVQVGDGASFNGSLGGSVTNNDTLIYATPGTLTSSVNISGSGTLTKNGPGALTLSGTQTYTNLTTVNAGSLKFSGAPPPSDITNAGALIFSPSGFVTRTNSISGPGAVTMSGSGAMLTLSNASTYTGGTTNAVGNIFIVNSAAVGTGPVVYTGGYVFVGNNAVITNDFILPASTSDLSMAGTNNNTGTWAGNVFVGGGASWRPGSDGGTLIFTGNALMGGNNFIVPRGTLQIASNAVISATGSAVAFGRDGSGGNRSANVTIKDNAVVTLGVCNLGGGQAGGNSTLTIQNNAVLNCGANNFDVQNVNRTTATTFLRLNGGTLTVGGFTKTKTSQTNVISFNGGILKAGKDNTAFLPALNLATNLVQAGGAKIDDGGFAITIVAPLVHDSALGATPDGGLIKLGAGTLTLGTPTGFIRETYTGPTIINSGTLALALTTLTNSAGVYVNSGSLLDASFAASTTPIAQMLWGNGSVKGNLTIGNGTLFAPGSNFIGTLTFSNTLTLATGSTNIFELSHSPLTNDSAIVFGALTNGGTLIVTNIGGTQLAAGDSFKLFNAASYSGTFSAVQLPVLLAGLAWNTNALTTNGTISVISIAPATPPVFGSINLSGNALVLSGSNGPANGSYYVLASTNLALPSGLWDVLATNPFDAGGNFAFTNTVEATQPQKFYLLQLP